MVMDKLDSLYIWFNEVNNNTEFINLPVDLVTIINLKNDLTRLSESIMKEQPYFSNRLFDHKDALFNNYGIINPFVFGQIYVNI